MTTNVVIEISKGSKVKYEYDKKKEKLICDRMLHTPMPYFFNYGYIEDTLSDDSDALDAIVLCDEPLWPTCHIKCKPIGILNTKDEKGDDPKIILVPDDSVDPISENINDICDLTKKTKENLKYFFEHYKELEKGKWVKVKDFGNKDDALQKIIECKKLYVIKEYRSDTTRDSINDDNNNGNNNTIE
jgi:inorganic pyrophosphatase